MEADLARCERCGRTIDTPFLAEARTGLDLCLGCVHPAYNSESAG